MSAAVDERDSAWCGQGGGQEGQAADNLSKGQGERRELLTIYTVAAS